MPCVLSTAEIRYCLEVEDLSVGLLQALLADSVGHEGDLARVRVSWERAMNTESPVIDFVRAIFAFVDRSRDAFSILDKSSRSCFAPADHLLATCYMEGVGVLSDMEKAIVLLRRAAENQFTEAYATLYLATTMQNLDSEALQVLREGADKGSAFCYLKLGQVLRQGLLGADINLHESYEYLERASGLGSSVASRYLAKISSDREVAESFESLVANQEVLEKAHKIQSQKRMELLFSGWPT